MTGRRAVRLSLLVLVLCVVVLVYAWLNPSDRPQTLRQQYSPIVLAVAVPVFLALAAWIVVLVGKRRRQARAQLLKLRSALPGAVIFEVSLTPGVLEQVNVLRSASSPPLPVLAKENRPLLVSANRTGVTMWWGEDRALHLDRQVVRATNTTVTPVQYPGTPVTSTAAVTIDVDWPDGRRFRLALPLASPADERVSMQPGKLTALAEQVSAGVAARLGLVPPSEVAGQAGVH